MTTTATSAALVAMEPVFTAPERQALAGFLAGYSGLTREACALDLRQFGTWCHDHGPPLFAVRRADIECFGRDLEASVASRARPLYAPRRPGQPDRAIRLTDADGLIGCCHEAAPGTVILHWPALRAA